jgi:hypothetical protein
MKIHTLNNVIVHEYPEKIYVIKNLISHQFCNKIVNIMKHVNFNNRISYKIKNNVMCEELTIYKLIELANSQLNIDEQIILRNLTTILYSLYIRSIVYTINTVNEYIFANNTIPRMTTMLLRKIDGATRQHVDSALMDNSVRLLSCVIAYNDDYIDGLFHFPNQNIDLKLEMGDILLFPPYWTHPHYTDAPVGNVRYTSTFWFVDDNTQGLSIK